NQADDVSMFLESFLLIAGSTIRDRCRIELPFGRGKTSPVAAADVAGVVAAVLTDPAPHLGRIYELTGPRSQDMHGVAREYTDALSREVTYSDIGADDWERKLKGEGLPEHLTRHLITMGELHRAGRYDRLADGVERVTGRPARWASGNLSRFTRMSSAVVAKTPGSMLHRTKCEPR
ncbi:MAG: hypothetical protein ABI651_10260, partial [Verrucomicrobiota bacterium]